MDRKLSGWTVKSLSLAGRVTLAHSVLSAIPAYVMQTSVIPVALCEEIDKRVRNFVWGSSNDTRKVHLVSWEKICENKDCGGLGLKMSKQLNRAYMLKLAFTFLQNPDALWVRVLQSKYFKEVGEALIPCHKSAQSPIWRAICKEWPTMLQGSRAAIRNGKETMFWTTRWVDSGVKLIDAALDPTNVDLEMSVADLVTSEGSWDFSKLQTILPAEAIDMIAGMSTPAPERGEDQWVWGMDSKGQFTIKSAYNLLRSNQSSSDRWSSVWFWRGPNKVRFFLWLAFQEKLLTNAQRLRRNLSSDASCSHCLNPNEDVLHIIRDCPAARDVWSLIGGFDINSANWQEQRQTWLTHYLSMPNGLLFGLVCWCLWKARNDRVFSDSAELPIRAAARIMAWAEIVKGAMERSAEFGNANKRQVVTPIAWDPGPSGWTVLNSDGSVLQPSGKAAAGGLIRDDMGRCSAAYSLNLGTCSITRAELRGMLFGLQLAWERGHRRVIAQLDSAVAVDLLKASGEITHHHAAEVYQFRELLSRDWCIQVQHSYREANKAADSLASRGHSLGLGSHIISTADRSLGFYLRYDCIGISEDRLISIIN
ncbi:Putative ribonuclease H protein At1g65750 [Linum perenne]